VAGFMPAIMGSVMSRAAAGGGGAAAGFLAGLGLLIGAQAIVFVCGLLLWLRERRGWLAGRRLDRTRPAHSASSGLTTPRPPRLSTCV
jgi:hypothetical protein